MELKTTNKESGTNETEMGRIHASASKGRPTQEAFVLRVRLYAYLDSPKSMDIPLGCK